MPESKIKETNLKRKLSPFIDKNNKIKRKRIRKMNKKSYVKNVVKIIKQNVKKRNLYFHYRQ